MKYGQFNYYKIKFTLEILQTKEEKRNYLLNLQEEITCVIECFEKEKTNPLIYYAELITSSTEIRQEFIDFISEMVKHYSTFIKKESNLNDELLKYLVIDEIKSYKRLSEIITLELQKIIEEEKIL